MKKFFLSVVALLFVFMASAQLIESKKDGDYYYLVSPNARYYAGSQQGSTAYRYDIESKETNFIDPEGVEHGFKTNAISNSGVVAGAYNFKAALWLEGNNYEFLPLPEDGLTELEIATNDAVAITPDGKCVVVAFNVDAPKTYFVYTEQEDGIYEMVKLPMPEKDPVYGMYAQWIGIKDISMDGNVLVGLFMADDGRRQLPLIWHKENGVWSYDFWGLNVCLKEGKTIPPYPYDEILTDPETGEDVLPYEIWEEWIKAQYEAEAGNYYELRGMSMSGNGRYISFTMSIQPEGQDYAVDYGAVYDLTENKLEVFKTLENATGLSVNDEGEVVVATPSMEEFRWSYVFSINEPTKKITLTEWVKGRSNGVIDLAEYMEYSLVEETTVAEGTAYLSKEGNGLVTYQSNVLGTGLYESFFIRFDLKSSNRPIFDDSQIAIYPNPTTGLLNLSAELTDVVVFDVTGRQVMSQSSVVNTIDLSALNAGIYYVVGVNEGKRIGKKVVLTK